MKRLAFIGPGVVLWLLWALTRPEKISLTTVMVVIIITLVALVISLVAFPITEYITVEKWHQTWEEMKDPSWREIINAARNVHGLKFILKGGRSITGKLVSRSDSKNTFGIRTEAGVEIIHQSQLDSIIVPDDLADTQGFLKRKIEALTQQWEVSS